MLFFSSVSFTTFIFVNLTRFHKFLSCFSFCTSLFLEYSIFWNCSAYLLVASRRSWWCWGTRTWTWTFPLAYRPSPLRRRSPTRTMTQPVVFTPVILVGENIPYYHITFIRCQVKNCKSMQGQPRNTWLAGNDRNERVNAFVPSEFPSWEQLIGVRGRLSFYENCTILSNHRQV